MASKEEAKTAQTTAARNLTTCQNALTTQMAGQDASAVRSHLTTLNDAVKRYNDAHTKLMDIMEEDDDPAAEEREQTRYDTRLKSALSHQTMATEWLLRNERTPPTAGGARGSMQPSPGDAAFPSRTTESTLPKAQLDKFSGDPTQFRRFMDAFEARIASRAPSEHDKLFYLHQHLTGEAKNLVECCFYVPPESAYSKACELLEEEYGDPYLASMVYLKELHAWPVIKNSDNVGLRKLHQFLLKLQFAMCSQVDQSEMSVNVSHLDYPHVIQTVFSKLPMYLQHKWRDLACDIRISSRKPKFTDLVSFISKASKSANDPVYGQSAVSFSTGHSSAQSSAHSSSTQQRSKSRSENVAHSFGTTDVSESNCVLCNSPHDLEECSQYNDKSFNDRRQFVIENKLCFGCLGRSHQSRNCTQRRTCSHCSKNHPSSLHSDNFKANRRRGHGKERPMQNAEPQPPDASTPVASMHAEPLDACTNASTSGPTCQVMHAILPVRVRQKGRSDDHDVLTYAFLDNGSSGCFVSNTLSSQLQATSKPTTLKLRTISGETIEPSNAIDNLIVTDINGLHPIDIKTAYTKPTMPVTHEHIPRKENLARWPHLSTIIDKLPPYYPDLHIGLLIGNNCPAAIQPLNAFPSQTDGPYAVELRHGWSIHGPIDTDDTCNGVSVHATVLQAATHAKEEINPHAAMKLLERDFIDDEQYPDERGLSQDDRRFMEIVKGGISFNNQHFTVPLPFRNNNVSFPESRKMACQRLMSQRAKMMKDEGYRRSYKAFIDEMLAAGYASKVPSNQLQRPRGTTWYLPHHGVFNANKPGKIRVVFDCSASCNGASLNSELLQGPDLTNSICSVQTRFRTGEIPFMADIEKMFFQVRVPDEQRSYLRFLWWPNDDLDSPPHEYQMNVHLFGATSSPSVVNFALRQIAEDPTTDPEVSKTILNHFYVDDCLRSVDDPNHAIHLIQKLRTTCEKHGFHLTKFICGDPRVMESIPGEERATDVRNVDLGCDPVPLQRALGVKWDIQNDQYQFHVAETPSDVIYTRRRILSIVSSLYDPLGFVAPVIFEGKRILQELCKEEVRWDDPAPREIRERWVKWLSNLTELAQVSVPRCLKPPGFGDVVQRQLVAFADASYKGYGAVVYLRQVDHNGRTHVSFIAGKARIAPMKSSTIPKLELTAALTALKLAQAAKRQLMWENIDITYVTDSTAVIGYIHNDQERHPIFVANRVATIRKYSSPCQWRHIASSLNPADQASRGIGAKDLVNDSPWLKGPPFLKEDMNSWPLTSGYAVQCSSSSPTDSHPTPTERLMNHPSDWKKLVFFVAVFMKLKEILRKKSGSKQLSNIDLRNSELSILGWLHQQHFPKELAIVAHTSTQEQIASTSVKKKSVPKGSPLYRLDPFVDSGVLRVGGRLRRSSLPDETMHPIILPKKSHITTLIVRHEHVRLGHAGRTHVLAALRERYWLINGNSVVRHHLTQCVCCHRLRSPPQEQKMADLSEARVQDQQPPWTHTGVDYFGPFTVRDRRSNVKRYGVIFTCLSSRAVHIEIANSLDTDSCINAIRRFIARRGHVKVMYSDNGTNFVSANKELSAAVKDLNVHDKLMKVHGIEWRFNPPGGSQQGGAWERVIRTIRKVLSGLLIEHGERLNSESLHTLMCEVESIVNSRPITTVSIDSNDPEPLSPSHILTGKSTVTLTNIGHFQDADLFLRKRWKQVQKLANLFWSRWRREFLCLLQNRQKWTSNRRNINVGDIVLLVQENVDRHHWPMARVVSTEVSSDGSVRTASVASRSSTLRRPVSKLVLLLPSD